MEEGYEKPTIAAADAGDGVSLEFIKRLHEIVGVDHLLLGQIAVKGITFLLVGCSPV